MDTNNFKFDPYTGQPIKKQPSNKSQQNNWEQPPQGYYQQPSPGKRNNLVWILPLAIVGAIGIIVGILFATGAFSNRDIHTWAPISVNSFIINHSIINSQLTVSVETFVYVRNVIIGINFLNANGDVEMIGAQAARQFPMSVTYNLNESRFNNVRYFRMVIVAGEVSVHPDFKHLHNGQPSQTERFLI